MDDYPVDWSDRAGYRDRDVYQSAGLVDQAVQLGGGLVAEQRMLAGSQHGSPELCITRRLAGERRVNTESKALPAPRADQDLHPPGAEPGLLGLSACDYSLLEPQQPTAPFR
jgi:hypothetical protein